MSFSYEKFAIYSDHSDWIVLAYTQPMEQCEKPCYQVRMLPEWAVYFSVNYGLLYAVALHWTWQKGDLQLYAY